MFAYESLESHHLTVSTDNSKSQLLAQELFDEYHKKLSHICYSKMKDYVIEHLHELKLSHYMVLEVLEKLLILIKECPICNQNNPLKRKKKLRTTPTTVLKILYLDFALLENHYVLVMIDGFSKYLWTVVTESQSTNIVITALHSIQNQLDCPIITIRADNFKSFTSPQLIQEFPEIKFESTIPNEHTSNGVAERVIRTLRALLKKDESTFRGRNSFQRRVAVVTRNYNRTKHSSTGERPRDLIFAFSTHGISRDPEDIKLKNLKLETLQYVNNPVAYRIYKQGKPETAVGILQSVNENDDTVMIKSKENSMIKRPVLKIRPLEIFKGGRSKNG
uniref:Integrase catalytic domain-containing protein n=1 Tax=Strongyloides papillosus TaxID=174720 RepID=A0A0N5BC97_STREA